MIVVGVADDRGGGAAVSVNGDLISSVGPMISAPGSRGQAAGAQAFDAALRAAGLDASAIDRIVFGTSFAPPLPPRAAGRGGRARALYQSLMFRSGLYLLESDLSYRSRATGLGTHAPQAELEVISHPQALANLAYRTQPARRCLTLTLSLGGDGVFASAWMGSDGQLDPLWNQSTLAALPLFLARIAEQLSLPVVERWETLAQIAAAVQAPPGLLDHARKQIFFDGRRFSRAPILDPAADEQLWSVMGTYTKEEQAATAQALLRSCAVSFVRFWVTQTRCHVVALSGALFANSGVLGALAEEGVADQLWTPPRLSGPGLAVGAALASTEAAPTARFDDALGPAFDQRAADAALDGMNLGASADHALARAATSLARGGQVAFFLGRQPMGRGGPLRRCIVSDPMQRPTGTADRLLIPAQDAQRWVTIPPVAGDLSPHHPLRLPATALLRACCPTAVRQDGRARVQLVPEEMMGRLDALRQHSPQPLELLQMRPLQIDGRLARAPAEALQLWRDEGLNGLVLDTLWLTGAGALE